MLTFLSRIYGAVVKRRNAAYDNKRRPIVPIMVPVISVGNITTGGTGKTPVVQLIVRMLQEQGKQPAVVLRGYRRRSKGLLVVHNGSKILCTPDQAGDEAYLHASVLNVPVVVSSDKVEAAAIAAGTLPCDVVVVDDGYQHRALHRDLDVVLVDQATLKGILIPAGRLREPLAGLNRADIIVCMDGVEPESVFPFAQQEALIVSCEMRADFAVNINNSEQTLERGGAVMAVAGIANPNRFINALESLGFQVGSKKLFADHYRYTGADLDRLCATASEAQLPIVSTEKDAVKIRALMDQNEKSFCRIFVLPVNAHVSNNAFAELIAKHTQTI